MYMKRIMKYGVLLLLILTAHVLQAQTQEDVTVFTAMGDEQARTKEQLVLPMMNRPFYVSYTVALSQQYSVEASLGSDVKFDQFTSSFDRFFTGIGRRLYPDK